MWKIYHRRIESYRCKNCNRSCKNPVSYLLSISGIAGMYSCNYPVLYKSSGWKNLLEHDMGNVIVMKKEHVKEILNLGEDFGDEYPHYVDNIYHYPLPQEYTNSRTRKDGSINIIVYPE